MSSRIAVLICMLAAVAQASPGRASHQPLTDHAWVSWTSSYGLFPGPFRAVAEDPEGYLWLGVSGDLIRFDGVRFSDAETLSHGTWVNKGVITVLCATRDGSIWIGRSVGGLSQMRNGRLTNFGVAEGLPDASTTAIVEDASGMLWTGTRSGVRRYVRGRWEPPSGPSALAADGVESLFSDRSGRLWLANTSGLHVLNGGDETFTNVAPSTGGPISGFAQDAAGTLWVTDAGRGFRPFNTTDSIETPHFAAKGVNGVRLLVDREANLWVATRGQGLFRIFKDERGASQMQHLGQDDGLSSDIVLALFEDHGGNIWAGTENSLVRITPVKGIAVNNFSAAHQVTATSDGSVWVGTTQGLYQLRAAQRKQYTETNGLPSKMITGLSNSWGTDFWVATDRGLAAFSNGRFQPVSLPDGIRPRNITALTVDQNRALWFCDSELGLFRLAPDARLTSLSEALRLGRRRCPASYTDHDGRVWIGFVDGGLAVYQNGRLDQYSDHDGLTGGIVTAVYQDHSGTVWVGTNKGLSRFDHGRFTSFTQDSGLPAKGVAGIADDDLGNLWLGTITGILRVDTAEFDRAARDRDYRIRYTSFDAADGLAGPPLYLGFPNTARGTDGRLWFVTTSGVAVIDPRQVRRAPQRAHPKIESVSANGQVLEVANNMRLPAKLTELFIDYTALNFASAAKTRFRYRLDGVDKSWIDADLRRQAIYTHLPPGNYRFLVSAGIDGGWDDDNIASLTFSVAPTFYQTSWFYSGAALLVVTTVGLVWKRRLNRVTSQFSMVVEERTRMAREIHDTLLQSLVGVALQFDVIGQTVETSPAAAREQLYRTRDEVEAYIREARQSIWDLRSPSLQTLGLDEALRTACNNVAAARGIQCKLTVTGSPQRYPVRTEENLLRIGQEAIMNAVRHAKPSQIRVNLDYREHSLVLRVSDDGHGFDPAVSPQARDGHWGLADMRERATRIGAKFTLETKSGNGTQVETLVPFRATT